MMKFKYDFFTIVATLLLLFTSIPFFLLGNTAVFFAVSTALYLGSFFIYINNKSIKLEKYKRGLIPITLILFLYISFPFRKFDAFLFVNIWLLIFITFLYLRDRDLIKIIQCFFDIIYIICLGALIVIVLKIIGIELPKWEYHPTGTDIKKSIYYIYPGTTELIFQNYQIFGRSLFRVNGIFSEPGHFGVICASCLFMNPVLFSKRKRWVILIAGLFSLSMGFYVLLTAYLLIKSKMTIKQVFQGILVVALILAIGSMLSEEFLFRFFGNKISSENDVLDARTSMDFALFYSKFEYSIYWIFGAGSMVLSEFNVTSSDYRAFIAKYGVIAILLYLIWFFILNKFKKTDRYFYLVTVFFIIVFAHRSWLVSYLIFYFMLYAIIFSYQKVKVRV